MRHLSRVVAAHFQRADARLRDVIAHNVLGYPANATATGKADIAEADDGNSLLDCEVAHAMLAKPNAGLASRSTMVRSSRIPAKSARLTARTS